MIGWVIAGVTGAAVVAVVLWKTFAPFVKKILNRYVYDYFKLFVKYIHGKFFGEVELDGVITFEREIPESEVPLEFVEAVRRRGRVNVTHDKKLQMQLSLY